MSEREVVALDVAKEEFDRFAELMDLDLSEDDMDADDKRDFRQQRSLILKAIQSGHVTVNGDGEPTVNLKRPTKALQSITLHEACGSTFLARDTKKEGKDVSKMFSMIQDMAKIEPGQLADVKQRDFKVIQALATLFLA